MKKFIVAVKVSTAYSYMFINIDDNDRQDFNFCFNVVSNTFFSQELVNRMLSETVKYSTKSLHSSDDMVSVKNKANMNPDIVGIMLWNGITWCIYE